MVATIQTVYILFNLLIIATAFGLIGKEPAADANKYKATGQTAFIHGIFTVAFLIWWDTPDTVSLYAKIAAIALMWLPWIYDLADIHKPAEPITLKSATIGALIMIARTGVVLGFWVLY
jgi:hypothetical protein